jgi:methionyl-tRNA formyltransferase
MNILLVGEESAGVHTLQRLAESSHRVVGVVASPEPKYGSPATLWRAAKKLGYRTLPAENVKDPRFAEQLRADETDVLLNLHSLYVIHRDVIQAPRIGSFNLHPGPLPRYAGLNPVCWALYFAEKTHGVTLHRMTAEIDAGPIVYQSVFPVTEKDTGLSVSIRCIQEGLPMVARLLATLEGDPTSLPQIPQDATQRQFFGRAVPHQGHLVWSLAAEQIVNFVRACDFCPFLSPWGHPRTRQGKLEIQIVKATRTGRPADAPPGTVGYLEGYGLVVACADQWISVSKVKVQNKLVASNEVLCVNDRLEDGEVHGPAVS